MWYIDQKKRKMNENNNDRVVENIWMYSDAHGMLFASLWSTSDWREVLVRLIYERFNAWEDASPLAKRLENWCHQNQVNQMSAWKLEMVRVLVLSPTHK